MNIVNKWSELWSAAPGRKNRHTDFKRSKAGCRARMRNEASASFGRQIASEHLRFSKSGKNGATERNCRSSAIKLTDIWKGRMNMEEVGLKQTILENRIKTTRANWCLSVKFHKHEPVREFKLTRWTGIKVRLTHDWWKKSERHDLVTGWPSHVGDYRCKEFR